MDTRARPAAVPAARTCPGRIGPMSMISITLTRRPGGHGATHRQTTRDRIWRVRSRAGCAAACAV